MDETKQLTARSDIVRVTEISLEDRSEEVSPEVKREDIRKKDKRVSLTNQGL